MTWRMAHGACRVAVALPMAVPTNADMTIYDRENSRDILDDYHASIGGEPVAKSKSGKKAKGGKRSATDAFSESPAPSAGKKRGRKSAANGDVDSESAPQRQLPVGSWEDHVERIASVIEETTPDTAASRNGREKEKKELIGLLEWKDRGVKTQHKMKVLRQKCPQKLLDYYENHL